MPAPIENSGSVTLETNGKSLVWPIAFTTSLFLMWGLSYGLLDVLNKHFQEVLHIDMARSTLLQFAYFGSYAIMSWPAGRMMERFGYKKSILFGLSLYALGAFMFIPSAAATSFELFVLSLFVLASGLCFIETTASPYVTLLGNAKTGDRRIAVAQCFFGIGAFLGPIIGGSLFFGLEPTAREGLRTVELTYAVIGVCVLVWAFVISRTWMPEAKKIPVEELNASPAKPLFKQRHFVWAVVAQWLSVGGQIGLGALFINFAVENWADLTSEKAAYLLSIGMALFLAGRFVSTALLGKFSSNAILAAFGLLNVILTLLVVLDVPKASTVALIGTFFGCGGTYAYIFALGLRGLGANTKRGAAALVFGVSGGAIIPPIMGMVADAFGINYAFLVVTPCYVVVVLFALKFYKPEEQAQDTSNMKLGATT
jgi:FHS family L-fucose permease-like MFS transporter